MSSTSLASTAAKRLAKEFAALTKEPVAGLGAAPLDEDLFVWHANIAFTLKVEGKAKVAPMHVIIVFKHDYPASAPDAGFAIDFPYHMGASHSGGLGDSPHLVGKKIICLDILGNFSNIHTEWASDKGSGWSPAYSVQTLLLNLQALLCDLDSTLSIGEKQTLLKQALAYQCQVGEHVHSGASPYPPMEPLEEEPSAQSSSEPRPTEPVEPSGPVESMLAAADLRPTVAPCYFTLQTWEDDTLGFGVAIVRGKPKSFGELLSWTAFQQGFRQTSQKEHFTHFLPAFINPRHAWESTEWVARLRTSLATLATACNAGGSCPAIAILPGLINSMVVEINRGDKASAIAFFEALCSFWRTLRWIVVSDAAVRAEAMRLIHGFIADEANRHKSVVPDVGCLLALSTAVTDTFEWSSFVDAYLDESFVRGVMWWQSECPPRSGPVFAATCVSRSIFLFQLTLVRVVIGGDADATCAAMDASNGRMPDRLEALQRVWRSHVEPESWGAYAEATGCSAAQCSKMTRDTDAWIADNVRRSERAGPLYQRSGKGSKGGHGSVGGKRGYDGGGRGGGKGGYRYGGGRGGGGGKGGAYGVGGGSGRGRGKGGRGW